MLRILKFSMQGQLFCTFEIFCLVYICVLNRRHLLGWFKSSISRLYQFIEVWCLLNVFISGILRYGVNAILNFIQHLTETIFNLNAHSLFLILSLFSLRNLNIKHLRSIY
jgi:hypothetical protein